MHLRYWNWFMTSIRENYYTFTTFSLIWCHNTGRIHNWSRDLSAITTMTAEPMKAVYSGGGGDSCAVVGCTSNRKKGTFVENIHYALHQDCPCCVPYKLHNLPKDEEIRLKWLAALKRKKSPEKHLCMLLALLWRSSIFSKSSS